MQSKATKGAAPSPTEAASKYHTRNTTPPARRGASPARRFWLALAVGAGRPR